jgi:hypothetical protein
MYSKGGQTMAKDIMNEINDKEKEAQDLIRYSEIVEVIDEKDKHGYWRTYYLVDEHGLPCKVIKRNGKVDEIIRFKRVD